MAVKRITDLPILEILNISDKNFIDSYMEVSYNTDLTNKFESKAFKCGDFVNFLSSSLREMNEFPNSIYISNGLSLEGDMIVNDTGLAGKYRSSLNFGDIKINAVPSTNYQGNIEISGASVSLNANNASVLLTNNTVGLHQYATVDNTNGNDGKSVVNCDYLSAVLDEWKQKIINELTAHLTITYDINFPMLSFIYSDHEITGQDSWKLAGSTISLNEYDVLNQWLRANNNLNWNKLRHNGSGKTGDAWFYTYNSTNNTLTLPKSDLFLQCTNTVSDAGGFTEAGLPNITGKVSIAGLGTSGTASHRSRTLGAFYILPLDYSAGAEVANDGARPDDLATFDASRSNKIYGKSTTVLPNSNKMLIYFYVGPKNKTN